MDDSLTQIKFLINKYQEKANTLKQELGEIEQKLNSFKETFEALQKEAPIKTEANLTLSDKYAHMKKREALMDIIDSDVEKKWKPHEVVDKLMSNGFQTQSTNLLRDVYAELNRLATKKHEVLVIKTSKGVFYQSRHKEKAPLLESEA